MTDRDRFILRSNNALSMAAHLLRDYELWTILISTEATNQAHNGLGEEPQKPHEIISSVHSERVVTKTAIYKVDN